MLEDLLNNLAAGHSNTDVEHLRQRIAAALPGWDVSTLRLHGGRWFLIGADGLEIEVSEALKQQAARG